MSNPVEAALIAAIQAALKQENVTGTVKVTAKNPDVGIDIDGEQITV